MSAPLTTLEQRAAEIAAKRAVGVRVPEAAEMLNTGRRRSPEKRALLARIAEAAAKPEPPR
jgi:hypothetical protein